MIEVKNLSLSYKINDKVYKPILKDINLEFPDVGMFFIIGKSGSGKSSLLSVLEGINKPNKGKILINDINLYNKNNLNEYYSNIGILYQDFNLFNNLKVIDNLKIVCNNERLIDEYLLKYNLLDKKNSYIYNLSGGEKQRIALIRSLIKNPLILFADEPTGSLDLESSNFLIDELYNISKEKLVIIVTHNEELIKKYDSNYIRLENGSIIENNISNLKEEKDIKFKKCHLNKKILFKKIFKNSLKFSILSSISLMISFIILLFSFNFYNSFNSYSKNIINEYCSNNIFTCSKINKIKSNNSLSITKKEIPDEQIEDLLKEKNINYLLKNNLDYFTLNNKAIIKENEYQNINFKPFFDENTINNEIIVNDLASEKYNLSKGDILNIVINKEVKLYLNDINDYCKEEIKINHYFIVKDVVKEFYFSNSPRIYYNYTYLSNLLSSFKLDKISQIKNNDINLIDLYTYFNNNQELNSYSKLIISNDIKKITSKDFQNYIKSNNYEITNEAYVLSSSFVSLINTLELGIFIFTIFIFIGTILILLFINISEITSSKKDIAISLSLGFKNKSILNLYFFKDLILLVISYLTSFLIFNYLKQYINNFINIYLNLNFKMNLNIFLNSSIILIFVIALALTSSLIFKNIKNISIYKELKEE